MSSAGQPRRESGYELSRPVLVGYLAGVALIMIAGQLGRLTGVRVTGETFIPQVVSFAGRLAQVNPGDVVMAAAVLVFLFSGPGNAPDFTPRPTAIGCLEPGVSKSGDLSPVVQVSGIAPSNPGLHDDERSGMRQGSGTGQVVSGPRNARRSQFHQRQHNRTSRSGFRGNSGLSGRSGQSGIPRLPHSPDPP